MDCEETATLRSLIETEIPEGRANLESSFANLERVAAYCEANYAQAIDKKAAFDETRRFTVQSLASVAYQVNTLACALLHTLDLQTDKVAGMVSQVHNVGEIISIHKEKVARREIGVLTVNKNMQKQPKIIAATTQERPQRYQRTPIDYTVLDGLGHGVKTPELINKPLVTRASSTISTSSSGVHYPVFPNYEHLLPKANINATLSRSLTSRGEHYRTPQIAATPVIDPHRFSTVTQTAHFNSMSNASNYSSISQGRDISSMPLPPPQLAPVAQYRLSTNSLDGLPPPPYLPAIDDEQLPLPPPPVSSTPSYETTYSRKSYTPSSLNTSNQSSYRMTSPHDRSYDWIPKVYLEKSIALYDYDAEKADELTLKENCIVYVLRKNEDGWFEGVLNGCTGLFPGNYVKAIN